jgi:predicted flap endonuclease-1-like 5' DNA nuclease
MFYLIWQMGLLLLLAFGVGLAAGWMIWSGDARSAEADAALAESERLRGENEALARRLGEAESRAAKPALEAGADPVVAPAPKPEPAPDLVKEDAALKTGASAEPSVRKAAPSSAKPKSEGGAAKAGAAAMPSEAETDNLMAIKGLGPKAAEALVAGGVKRYADIAGWSADDISAWDDKINGRGRIARDDWVGQAKTLAEKG